MPSQAQINAFLQNASAQQLADLQNSSEQRPANLKRIYIDLSVAPANPLKIQWPFRGLFVSTATDANTQVNLSSSDDKMAIDEAFPLVLNRAINFDHTIATAYLTWTAQPGKNITLYVGVDANINSGSLLSLNAGGVSISEGAAFTTRNFAIAAATQTQLFAANALRKVGTWVNETGATAWVGSAVVTSTGANKGIPVPAGATFSWKNSAALYCFATAAFADSVTLEES